MVDDAHGIGVMGNNGRGTTDIITVWGKWILLQVHLVNRFKIIC